MATRTKPDAPIVRATARFVRTAPRKVRVVADQIRGKGYEEAVAILRFNSRGAAEVLLKLLESAAANAENNNDLDPEELMITSISVDEGPTMRRFRPRARGRATRIEKRSCHIKIALTPKPDSDQ